MCTLAARTSNGLAEKAKMGLLTTETSKTEFSAEKFFEMRKPLATGTSKMEPGRRSEMGPLKMEPLLGKAFKIKLMAARICEMESLAPQTFNMKPLAAEASQMRFVQSKHLKLEPLAAKVLEWSLWPLELRKWSLAADLKWSLAARTSGMETLAAETSRIEASAAETCQMGRNFENGDFGC